MPNQPTLDQQIATLNDTIRRCYATIVQVSIMKCGYLVQMQGMLYRNRWLKVPHDNILFDVLRIAAHDRAVEAMYKIQVLREAQAAPPEERGWMN